MRLATCVRACWSECVRAIVLEKMRASVSAGRRHLLGLPDVDKDEAAYVQAMTASSSMLATTQSRLTAAIADVGEAGRPKITEAQNVSNRLLHHVCLFALATMVRQPKLGKQQLTKVASVLATMKSNPWPSEDTNQPGTELRKAAEALVNPGKEAGCGDDGQATGDGAAAEAAAAAVAQPEQADVAGSKRGRGGSGGASRGVQKRAKK